MCIKVKRERHLLRQSEKALGLTAHQMVWVLPETDKVAQQFPFHFPPYLHQTMQR